MKNTTRIDIVKSPKRLSFTGMQTLEFYQSMLSMLVKIHDSGKYSHEICDLAAEFGDIAYSVAEYLKESGFAKGLASMNKSGAVSFEEGKLKALIPLLEFKIIELEKENKNIVFNKWLSVIAIIISLISLFFAWKSIP